MTNGKLALLGGPVTVPPALQRDPHPILDASVKQALVDQADEQISIYDNGGVYQRLEDCVRNLWSLDHVLSVSSGTAALFSMYYSLNLQPGDEVIVPAYTFFATATPLLLLGATPVLADCTHSGNIDPESVAARISKRTRAVVVTHMWGIPCEMDRLLSLTVQAGIKLLEDASHAHGARYKGRVVGSFSDGAAWSLQGKKIITAGEGGIFATPHAEMFQRAVLVGHFNKRAKLEVTLPELRDYAATGTGLNLRMHPLGAALALAQFPYLEQQLRERREVAHFLSARLAEIDGLDVPPIPEGAEPAWYAFPLLYKKSRFPGVSKDRFAAAIQAEGAVEVDIPRSTCPLDEYESFRWGHIDRFGGNATKTDVDPFPSARSFHSSLLKMPVWYGPRRWEFANAYVTAIQKVARARLELA